MINRAQLRVGLVHHHEVHVPLGRALVREGLCSEADVLRGLAEQFGVDAVDLERTPPDARLLNHIPARVARQYRVVPLRIEKVLLDQGEREVLHIALPAPVSLDAVDAVRAVSGMPRVEAHIASDAALARALADLYGIETPAEPPAPPHSRPGAPAALWLAAGHGGAHHPAAGEERPPGPHRHPLEVLHTGPEDVVLAPLQAMEGLLAGEVHIQGALIVHGSDDESFDRVRELGARGFLASPRDEELLLRAVRRLRPDPGSPDSVPPSH
ncbi:general secretion pathway protein GspE [Myxococcus sp. MxC21-1]|nr:hypothetical protein [Myxococcus sp. MxC21-1]WNZ60244.1 general secretion pathway protein GspE [Myxococcus sp. MxC21-1]